MSVSESSESHDESRMKVYESHDDCDESHSESRDESHMSHDGSGDESHDGDDRVTCKSCDDLPKSSHARAPRQPHQPI